MINRRLVDLSHINYLVLDEADEMLNMGFQDAIDEILETASEDRNTWLYSATMPKAVAKIASNYMKDPVEVTCGTKNQAASTVEHEYYLIDNRDRYRTLRRIVDFCPGIYAIIFCRTRAETQNVAERLMADGYNTGGLHGDMSQGQRDGVMKQFKTKNITILVATDVASRGIDVDDISHVIHYQLPDDNEVYTHRSGRTGRAGKTGTSIALVGGRDKYKLVQIEKTIKCRMERKMVPSGEEVMKAMVFQSMENLINAQVHPKALKPFTEAIHELSEQMTVTEVLEKFIALNSSKILNFYKDAKDLNASGKSSRDKNYNDTKFRQLIDITVVDYPERNQRFDVVYLFLSHEFNQRLILKYSISENEVIPSLTSIFPSSNWMEREVFDMYGVLFKDHPDLRRILTDYGFEGHPLRKDFPLTGHTEVRYSEDEKKVISEPVKLEQNFRNFDYESPWEGTKYIKEEIDNNDKKN